MGKDTATLKKSKKVLIFFAILVYVAAIFYAKFLQNGIPGNVNPHYNWIPFFIQYSAAVRLLLFNALVFVPYGLLIAYIGKNKLWFFAVGLLVCFCMELLQPLAHTGIFEITTVIANLIGMVAGYFVFTFIAGLVKKKSIEKDAA